MKTLLETLGMTIEESAKKIIDLCNEMMKG